MILPPYYYTPTEDEIFNYYKAICEKLKTSSNDEVSKLAGRVLDEGGCLVDRDRKGSGKWIDGDVVVHAVLGEEPGDQDVGVGQVELLGAPAVAVGTGRRGRRRGSTRRRSASRSAGSSTSRSSRRFPRARPCAGRRPGRARDRARRGCLCPASPSAAGRSPRTRCRPGCSCRSRAPGRRPRS